MKLRYWIAALLRCKSIADVKLVVCEFSSESWSLQDRTLFSAIYTPHALRLIPDDQDKWKLLEDLAFLCWKAGS